MNEQTNKQTNFYIELRVLIGLNPTELSFFFLFTICLEQGDPGVNTSQFSFCNNMNMLWSSRSVFLYLHSIYPTTCVLFHVHILTLNIHNHNHILPRIVPYILQLKGLAYMNYLFCMIDSLFNGCVLEFKHKIQCNLITDVLVFNIVPFLYVS